MGYMHRLPEYTPARIAYKEMTEKSIKKTNGGQKLTLHQVITKYLNTSNIDLNKAVKLSKDRDLYNEMVVDRVMAKAVENYLPVDGDPGASGALPGQRLAEAGKYAKTTTTYIKYNTIVVLVEKDTCLI